MRFQFPGVLQSLLAGTLVFLLPGCGGGNEDQEAGGEMNEATPGVEEPGEGADLGHFLPGKMVDLTFGEAGVFEGEVRLLFREDGGFTLSPVARNDRKVSGTYRVTGPVVLIRIEDEERIAVLEFPGGIPEVGGEIQLDVGEEKIAKGRITVVNAHPTYGQVPRSPTDFRKLLGSSLHEREKQYVGRWTGGDQENQWTQIVREDHTYSFLYTGKAYDEDGEAVPGKKTRDFGHGIWTIANEVIYTAGFVTNGKKVPLDDEFWESYPSKIASMEAGRVVCIIVIDGDPLKHEERRIEEFDEPEMKPFNTPEALKGFDILKAYDEARGPEGQEDAPVEEESDGRKS